MRKRRYWHSISRLERRKLERRGTTWADVKLAYDQPSWCHYPDALSGIGGCWSLVGDMIHKHSDCGDCECADSGVTPDSLAQNAGQAA